MAQVAKVFQEGSGEARGQGLSGGGPGWSGWLWSLLGAAGERTRRVRTTEPEDRAARGSA